MAHARRASRASSSARCAKRYLHAPPTHLTLWPHPVASHCYVSVHAPATTHLTIPPTPQRPTLTSPPLPCLPSPCLLPQRLREMFDQLDSSGDGVLDGALLATSLASLPPDVSNALRPKISTFKNEFLAFSDFQEVVTNALATHAPSGPRHSLLPARGVNSIYVETKARRLRAQQAECTFQPEVNARSQKLAEKRRDPSRPLADQLLDSQKEYEARRLAAQHAQVNDIDKHCTFQPELMTRKYRPRDTCPIWDSKRSDFCECVQRGLRDHIYYFV